MISTTDNRPWVWDGDNDITPPATSVSETPSVSNIASALPLPTVVEQATQGQFKTATEVIEWQGLPVRAGGDKIFILKDGKKRWVTSAEVYAKMGFKFGDERKIDEATLSIIPEAEPLR